MWDKFRAREMSCALANKDRAEVPTMRNADAANIPRICSCLSFRCGRIVYLNYSMKRIITFGAALLGIVTITTSQADLELPDSQSARGQ